MSDERLREIYAEILSRRSPSDRTDCVAPERLMDLVERRGTEEDRLRALDHVMACARCREEFEMLRAMSVAARGTRTVIPRKVVGLAASIVFLVGVGLVYRATTDRSRADVYRSGAGVAQVSPVGEVARGSISFAWRAVPDVLRYRVEVIDSLGREVFFTSTTDTSLVLPDSVRLVAGAAYTWLVRAELSDGGAMRGAPRQFRIRP